eukprot:CAMPEP_0204275298 /NCGR_PEP_ID=MMETSP0468-20130131/25707_1 /ASSEMBLY_ACC=CAM_ASM_000383 /TAXON_ID=2969 /ORGANISM="Oxyrrhis marina" /LENGTH=183 /DNA_ID=CAMNT_0051251617 /DNA_START=42 /DNA_END=593 /DNA_ORIENTATION=-
MAGLFKGFTPADISGQNQPKSSQQRGIRSSILEAYPRLEEALDTIWPKKAPVIVAKCTDHRTLLVIDGDVLFFQIWDNPWAPTLKLLHKYPSMLPKFQADRGAVKFVLNGANVMCPGLTHADAALEDVEAGRVVALHAAGKENAMAIGFTVMSTAEIKDKNKGIGVDNWHFLGDGLFKLGPLS